MSTINIKENGRVVEKFELVSSTKRVIPKVVNKVQPRYKDGRYASYSVRPRATKKNNVPVITPYVRFEIKQLLHKALTTTVVTMLLLLALAVCVADSQGPTKVEAATEQPVVASPEPQKPLTIRQKIRNAFGDNGDLAIKIASCESHLDPNAKNPLEGSTASGLFQIIKGTWKGYTDAPHSEAFNEDKNIEVAKKLFDKRGTQPWDASKSCWSNSTFRGKNWATMLEDK